MHEEEKFDPVGDPLEVTAEQSVLPDSPSEDGRPSFFQRVAGIYSSAIADYQESSHKVRMASIALGVLALQGLDRARASVVFVPKIAVDVLQSTHSPTEAAVVGGLAFAGWCAAVGGATTEGLDQYPKTVNTFNESFPGVIGFFEDSLPGFEQPSQEAEQKNSRARRIGGRVLTGVKRGYTVVGIGSVAYVSTASAKGKARGDIHKLNANASLDGGAAVGAIVFSAGEAIVQLAKDHPVLAEHIQNDASNIKVWYGVAAFMIAQQYITTKIKKHKQSSKSTEELEPVEEEL